jgi:hypothetical protein
LIPRTFFDAHDALGLEVPPTLLYSTNKSKRAVAQGVKLGRPKIDSAIRINSVISNKAEETRGPDLGLGRSVERDF